MPQKIHCDLLDVYGVDWSALRPDQLSCIIDTIHAMQLIEVDGELYGFVGTIDAASVVGGFFVVQFPTELLFFTRDKKPVIETASPAETVLFVFLTKVGRLLLQNRHFQLLPLNMEIVVDRLKQALAQVLRECNVGPVVSLAPTPITVSKAELLQAFNSSKKVSRLQVTDPDARQIPEGFPYYNPERDRNAIIRESRLHDYPHLTRLDVTARMGSDVRQTHIGRDLVEAVTEKNRFFMSYTDQNDSQRVIRRQRRAKYEFHVDIDGRQLTMEALAQVMARLSQDPTLDIPVQSVPPTDLQIPLFGGQEEEDDEVST